MFTYLPLIFMVFTIALSPVSADQVLPKAMKSLSITVSTNAVQPGPSTIAFMVEITNTSSEPVQITTLPGKYPFGIRLLDEKGDDINKHALAGSSKNRSKKNHNLEFKANEKKQYTVKISKVKNAKAEEQEEIARGVYTVNVMLPVAFVVEGQYRGELIESNSIQVEVR